LSKELFDTFPSKVDSGIISSSRSRALFAAAFVPRSTEVIMRKLPIIVGCALALILSQSATADRVVSISLTKIGVSYETFTRDRNACLDVATKSTWGSVSPSGGATLINERNPKGFYDCMINKGYRADPNGYPTKF
jgi:hypothetical protein